MNLNTVSHAHERESSIQNIPFDEFLSGFKTTVKEAFHENWDFELQSYQRGIPDEILKKIMLFNPLSTCISKEFGGRGDAVPQCMTLMSEASYESLALSLMLSINYALFLQPVHKYADDTVKEKIFHRFLHQQHMGGLMITEPDYGSDALNMQTSYYESENHYLLLGKKHWAGLTGKANYWLVAARAKASDGLKRDIDFFICDMNDPAQQIVVEEYFQNLGLYLIPYGRNRIELKVPKIQRLIPSSTGVKLMLDTLHRSRFQFPGMGMGFIRRIMDEAIKHVNQRNIGGKSLYNYDQVQYRLSRIQSAYTIVSCLCIAGSERAGLENDLTGLGIEANSIKCITTDLMQESAQSLLQLVGAKGYRINHVAGRATVDSRPFQIFEGSNDILYIQIAEAVIKRMTAANEFNFKKFLEGSETTKHTIHVIENDLNFTLTTPVVQRKLVSLGKIFSTVLTLGYVLDAFNRGFNQRLLENAINHLKYDINSEINHFSEECPGSWIENVAENSFWLDYVLPEKLNIPIAV